MNLLALETTGSGASVAVRRDSGDIILQTSPDQLNHLRGLIPMIEELLEKCKLSLNDIDVIAVSEGPGSFTGIRIGVATARALAQALGLKTVGVPTLKTFAYHVPDYPGIICPIFDARRSQVYGGAYSWNNDGTCYELVEGGAYEISHLFHKLEEKFLSGAGGEVLFFGDGIAPYEKEIVAWSGELQKSSSFSDIRIVLAGEEKRYQNAASVAKLGYEIYLAGQVKTYEELKPVYMRKAEAERKLEEQKSGINRNE